MSTEEYEYIVVGSGAGGGPLAANLARNGARVLLLEAGSDPETYLYQVPCFHPYSTEEKEMAWDFFVHHYSRDEQRDFKYKPEDGGVFYPRAGTLGGCTAHNAMITVYPHESDWDDIAGMTGDDSWRAGNMRRYFERLENCTYADPGDAGRSGHGFSGWLSTSLVDPRLAIGDRQIVDTVIGAALRGGLRGVVERLRSDRKIHFDPNDQRNTGAEGLTSRIPLATFGGRRNGTREYIRVVQAAFPDRLVVRLNHLVTRVLFDEGQRATGVECLFGKHAYAADPGFDPKATYERVEYRCSREVILAGGAFNTPQLLMLSGIGPKAHLEKHGIACRVDRPGVGQNLQDRYEVGVVSTMKHDFKILEGATFQPPAYGEEGDACFREWQKGVGMYTSNGAIVALISRSMPGQRNPDLFIFALPGNFQGYYPGYSADIERSRNFLTWAILKAHTNNTSGEVRLLSADPRQRPYVNFHYFAEGTDDAGEDLDAVVNGIMLARQMNARNHAIDEERVPGPQYKTRAELAKWVTDNAWGHHASCSARIGRPDDRMAVVDSRFRVIGTKGLRVVDASVFPRIPGFFIVTPIYMISEKASDVILEERASTHAG